MRRIVAQIEAAAELTILRGFVAAPAHQDYRQRQFFSELFREIELELGSWSCSRSRLAASARAPKT
jgi:hypothetical protein